MPHIKEKHLLELHKTIDKSNEERDQFETVFRNERDKNTQLKSERNVLIHLSTVSVILLFTVVALYFITPNLVIQKRYLEANGLSLVKREVLETNILQKRNEDNQEQALTIENEEILVSNIESDLLNQMVYVVQIAASENELTSIFYRGLKGLTETYEDGYYKYFIGNFESLSEAQDYRKELLKIGFEDAFVASYENSKRQKIEEAW